MRRVPRLVWHSLITIYFLPRSKEDGKKRWLLISITRVAASRHRHCRKKDFTGRVESTSVYYINEVPIYKPSSAIIEIQSHGRKGLCKNRAARVKSTRPYSSLSTASEIVYDNDSLIDDHRPDFRLK